MMKKLLTSVVICMGLLFWTAAPAGADSWEWPTSQTATWWGTTFTGQTNFKHSGPNGTMTAATAIFCSCYPAAGALAVAQNVEKWNATTQAWYTCYYGSTYYNTVGQSTLSTGVQWTYPPCGAGVYRQFGAMSAQGPTGWNSMYATSDSHYFG